MSGEPTASQQRAFDQWCELVKLYDKHVLANELRAANLDLSYRFARENRIALDWLAPSDVRDLELHRRNAERFKTIKNKIFLQRFGLRFRDSTDFDILAMPQEKTAEIAPLRPETLGALFIPILVGVLVVTAAVLTIKHLIEQNDELGQKLDRAVRDADSKFCRDPNSPICQTWLQRKKIEGYDKRQTTIESLLETAKSGLSTVAKAAAFGFGLWAAIKLLGTVKHDRFEDRI